MPTVSSILEHAKEQKQKDRARPIRKKPSRLVGVPVPRLLQERMLTGYLQHWQSMFERSTTGIILDMARAFAYESVGCFTCEGTGIQGRPKDIQRVMAIARADKYEVGPLRDVINKLFQDCPKCGGTGTIAWQRSGWHLLFSEDAPFEPTNEQTVHHRKSHSPTFRAPPDDTILTSYAVVSRRLSRLPEPTQRVLGAAFGPEGESWVNTSRGRVWAVTELVPSGVELIRVDTYNPENKSRMERISEIADIEEASPTPNQKRVDLIAKAVKQAGEHLSRAIKEWNFVVGNEDEL